MKKILYLILLSLITNLSIAQNGTFITLKHQCKDGKERPFIVYKPNHLQSNKTYPLLVYLHGGISRPTLKKNPLAYIKKSELVHLADKGNFYLMFSYGQKGATWFDAVGTQMVVDEINTAKSQFKIDANKIFLSGFSDGGSGVFYLSMTNPFPFAGFIPMNGSVAVAQKLGEQELFPENINNRAMYVINTTHDILYPLEQITPTIEYLQKYSKNISFITPKGNHDMSYLKPETDNLIDFIQNNAKPKLETFTWEIKSPQTSVWCLDKIKIDTTKTNKKWHQAYEIKVFNRKAKFGLKYDYSYRGKGLKVKGFKYNNCTAQKMGVKINDIILAMENDTITSPYVPFYYLTKKSAGDSTSLTLLRDGKQKTIKGKFNEGFFYKVLRSSNQSGKIKAVIKKRKLFIYTSKIASFEINFKALKALKIRKVFINDKVLKKKQRTILL